VARRLVDDCPVRLRTQRRSHGQRLKARAVGAAIDRLHICVHIAYAFVTLSGKSLSEAREDRALRVSQSESLGGVKKMASILGGYLRAREGAFFKVGFERCQLCRRCRPAAVVAALLFLLRPAALGRPARPVFPSPAEHEARARPNRRSRRPPPSAT
jgi:hypothetical protein